MVGYARENNCLSDCNGGLIKKEEKCFVTCTNIVLLDCTMRFIFLIVWFYLKIVESNFFLGGISAKVESE